MRILLGTNNPAKILRCRRVLPHIDFLTLAELGISIDIEEGADSVENAYAKAKAYSEASGLPCLANDDALELDFLPTNEQPGAYVRRVFGRRLTDNELLAHYCELLKLADISKRKGRFILNYCLYSPDGRSWSFRHVDEAEFRLPPSSILNPGYPLASIHFSPEFNKMHSELSDAEKANFDHVLGDKIKELINKL